jgi:tRNA/rRNA methyltransferase
VADVVWGRCEDRDVTKRPPPSRTSDIPTPVVTLAVHAATRFVLVRPHYAENVGACARAIKTMGFAQLVLVRPGKNARSDHELAQKMAVRSWDVLASAAHCAARSRARRSQ